MKWGLLAAATAALALLAGALVLTLGSGDSHTRRGKPPAVPSQLAPVGLVGPPVSRIPRCGDETDSTGDDRGSAGCPAGGGMSTRAEWMPDSTMIFCACADTMNWANSFAAFGLRAPLITAVGDETMNVPSAG